MAEHVTFSGEHRACSHLSKASKELIQKARTPSGSGRFQQLSVRVRVFAHMCISVCMYEHVRTHHTAVQAVPMAALPSAPYPAASGFFSADFLGALFTTGKVSFAFAALLYVVDDPCF